LGNANYVPDKYTEKITSNQIVWRISGDNWKKVSVSIGKFLNLTNLSSDYDELLGNLKSEVNYERKGEEISQPALIENDSIEIISTDEGLPKTEPIELIDASSK